MTKFPHGSNVYILKTVKDRAINVSEFLNTAKVSEKLEIRDKNFVRNKVCHDTG